MKQFFELFGKIIVVGDAAKGGDLIDGKARLFKEQARFLQPAFLDKIGGRRGKIFLEKGVQFRAGEMKGAAQGRNGQVFRNMFFDKRRYARVDALVICGDKCFQVFVSRAGVEDTDGGSDFVHGEDGQLFI